MAKSEARVETGREAVTGRPEDEPDAVSAPAESRDELRESRDQLAVILREVADGITVQAPDGRLVFANEAAARLIGFASVDELRSTPPEEIVARFEVLDEERRPLPLSELPGRRALAGDGGERTICYRVRATGSERWSLVRATPVVGADGRVEFAVNVFHDVTERKRADERSAFLARASKLLSSSLDYAATLATVPRLVVPTLADWAIVDVLEADGSLRRVGTAHADPEKLDLLARVAPPRGYRRVVASGEPLLLEEIGEEQLRKAARDPDHLDEVRTLGPTALICVPLVSRGRTLGAITLASTREARPYGPDELALAQELASRAALAVDNALLYGEAQEAAQRLEESLARLDALLGSAPIGIGFWDRDLRYVRVNETLAELNGLPPEAHLGRTLAEVVPALAPALEPLYRQVLETGEAVEHVESTGADAEAGEERHWLSSYYPVKTQGGEIIGVGALITEVTEGRRGERDRAQRATQQAAVAELGQLALADVGVERLFEVAAARVATTLSVEYAKVLELLPGSGRLRLVAGVGWRDGLVGSATVGRDDSQAGFTLDSAEPVIVADLAAESRFSGAALLREHGVVSGVSVVIGAGAGGGPFGVLGAHTRSRRTFTSADVNFLTAVANVLAAAIERRRGGDERAQLLAAEQEARREAEHAAETLRRLERVTEATLAHLSLNELLAELLERIAELLEADTAAVLLLDREGGELVAWAAKGLEEEVERGVRIPLGQGFAGRIAAERRALTIPDIDHADVFNPLLRERGIKSLLGVPLRIEDRVIGVLHVGTLKRRDFGDRDRRLLQLVGDRVGLAMEQARLYESERSARAEAEAAGRRVAFLAEASRILTASLDYETTLQNVANLAGTTIADWMAVYLVDEAGALTRIVSRHRDAAKDELAKQIAERYPPRLDESNPQTQVLRGGPSLLLREITDEMLVQAAQDEEHLAIVRSIGLSSALIVPVAAAAKTLGTITFALEGGRRYDEDDLALAEELGRRVGLAVQNAQLYQEGQALLTREQEARRQAEARAQAAQALEFVGDGVLLLDRDDVVRLWNPAAAATTGLLAGTVIGRPAALAIPGWEELARRVPTVRAGRGAAARPETVPLDVGGRELWLSISAVEFAAGTVYAFRDVTEERTVEKLKSDFVSTVSHELRTPLAAIYGAALTLRREDLPLPEDQRANLLGVIADEAERLARIVNDILWTSRIESDALHITIETCDAVELARTVVESARVHVPPEVHLSLEPADVPPVAADPDKVRQVLGNLVENAIKYSPRGGPVSVRVERGGGVVRFLVSDRGLGIPPSEHERVFEKFYRLDPDLTHGVGGTGLGLYISRELVRRMGGRITVESTPGEGSIFAVEFPAATDVAGDIRE